MNKFFKNDTDNNKAPNDHIAHLHDQHLLQFNSKGLSKPSCFKSFFEDILKNSINYLPLEKDNVLYLKKIETT